MAFKRTSPTPVNESGTGVITMTTAYAPICAGTTATGALQVADSGLSTSGSVLTSNGAGALPSWQDAIFLIQGDSGFAGGTTMTLTGSTSGAVFTGSGSTLTESFNYLSLPTTTSANGQIKINSLPYFHAMGTDNVFMGKSAGNFTLNASACVGIGSGALALITSPTFSTAIGYQSAGNASQAANTIPYTSIGYKSLYSFAGSNTPQTAIGANAFSNLTGGSTSVAIGFNAGATTVNMISSVALGSGSLNGATGNRSANTAIGYNTLSATTTGSNNTCLGSGAGSSLATSDASNILINNAGTSGNSNSCRIGAGTGTGTQQLNQTFIHGIRGTTTVNNDAIAVLIDSAGQLGTVSSSIRYKENIEDMNDISSPILSLRPVAFDFIGKPSHKKQTGLIAEEVNEVMPSLVAYNQDGEVESVKYHDISILLLNEIQKALHRIEFLENKLKAQ